MKRRVQEELKKLGELKTTLEAEIEEKRKQLKEESASQRQARHEQALKEDREEEEQIYKRLLDEERKEKELAQRKAASNIKQLENKDEDFDANETGEPENQTPFFDTKPFLKIIPELMELPPAEREERMAHILKEQAALRDEMRKTKAKAAEEKASKKGKGRGKGRKGKNKNTEETEAPSLVGIDAALETKDAQMKRDRELEDEHLKAPKRRARGLNQKTKEEKNEEAKSGGNEESPKEEHAKEDEAKKHSKRQLQDRLVLMGVQNFVKQLKQPVGVSIIFQDPEEAKAKRQKSREAGFPPPEFCRPSPPTSGAGQKSQKPAGAGSAYHTG